MVNIGGNMKQTTQLFLKVPKALLYCSQISIEECILYAYLLDKRALSEMTNQTEGTRGKFLDSKGVFCNASVDELSKVLRCGKDKINKMKKTLKSLGLVDEKRQLAGSNKIYVYDIPATIETLHVSDFQTYVNRKNRLT